MTGGSSGILLVLLGLFFLLSFVTGRLDWLKRLRQDVADQPGTPTVLSGGLTPTAAATPVFGPTGVAPTTTGRTRAT